MALNTQRAAVPAFVLRGILVEETYS